MNQLEPTLTENHVLHDAETKVGSGSPLSPFLLPTVINRLEPTLTENHVLHDAETKVGSGSPLSPFLLPAMIYHTVFSYGRLNNQLFVQNRNYHRHHTPIHITDRCYQPYITVPTIIR